MRTTTCFIVWVLISACGNEPGGPVAPPPDGPRGNPVGFTFEAIEARSFTSFGWSGLIHDLRVPERTPFGVQMVSCDSPSGDGICTFTGPVDAKGTNVVNRKRCLNRTRQTCNVDSDCGPSTMPPAPFNINRCAYIYDPPASSPLTGAAGKVGACGWTFIPIAPPGAPPSISGTIDLTSGELNLQNLTILLLQNGISSTYRGACAECIGDDVPNDGKQNGRCTVAVHGEAQDVSPDIGQPCDTNRTGSIPNFEGDTSMDCSPTYRVTDGPGAALGGAFTSSGYQVSISDSSPDCTDGSFPGDPAHPGNKKCFCGFCSLPDTTRRACTSNSDCPTGSTCGGPSDCNPNPPPFNSDGTPNGDHIMGMPVAQCRAAGLEMHSATRGNTCRGGKCDWDPETGTGTCAGLFTASGQKIGCYPSGVGATVFSRGGYRKQGNVFIADTANARCTRIQSSAAVNGQLGLPGLTFQRRAFRIIPEFP